MLTDISLRSADKTIIIDAKYYQNTLTTYFEKERVHSGNLYQICAYLQNIETNGGNEANASSVLLYPVTKDEVSVKYEIATKSVRVETLNLADNWSDKLISLISG